MKKIIGIVVIMLLMGYFFIIKRTTVNEGMEAVIVKKPWFIGKGGVQTKPIHTGTIWSVASTEIKLISLKAFTIKESFKEILTKDNIPIDFNVNLSFKYQKGKGSLLVSNFGESEEWYTNLLSPPLQRTVEVAVRKKTLLDMTDDVNAVKEIKESIVFGVDDFFKKQSIPVELVDISIGKITPPQEIIEASIKTEVEKENIKRQKEQIRTQELRKKAEHATANADRAYMIRMGMTPREYLEMKRIELETKQLSNQRVAINSAKDSNGSIQIHINLGK